MYLKSYKDKLNKDYIMKNNIIFVGDIFKTNQILNNYILRVVKDSMDDIDAMEYFQDSDKGLLLFLEKKFHEQINLLIVTSKNNFPLIGKLLSTITEDNQVLKDGNLIPSSCSVYEKDSYLLEKKSTNINVIQVNELQNLPKILLNSKINMAKIQIFDQTVEDIKALFNPIAQSSDIKLHFTQITYEWIELEIRSKKYGNITHFIESSKSLMPKSLIVTDNIPKYIIQTLQKCSKKISFAESCTGGLLAYMITQNSGASTVFEGSLVTYSNQLKSNWLAVDDKTLENMGAVSYEVVDQMSDGVLSVSYADYALSISGIAGPSGATQTKNVGDVFISARSKEKVINRELNFKGDRVYIQEQSALYALKLLLELDKNTFF